MNYNIVIMIVEKDMEVIKFTIPYIQKNIMHKDIILIGKKNLENECRINFPSCKFIDEDNLYLEINYNAIKTLVLQKDKYAGWRTGWYFQQFLKMTYALVCEDTYYLIWDADTIPLRTIPMINSKNGKPYFDVKTEYNKPYFTTLKKLFVSPVQRQVPFSYISEHMLINVEIMKCLIADIEKNSLLNGKYFFEKIMAAICDIDVIHSGFSEFETYGNYVNINYQDLYEIRQLKSLRGGKYYLGNKLNDGLLEWAADSYDLISIENANETINVKVSSKITELMKKMSLEDIVENMSIDKVNRQEIMGKL